MPQIPYAGDVAERKTALRAVVRQERRARVPGRDRAADAADLVAAVLGLVEGVLDRTDERRAASTVAVYESLRLEPPTDAVIEALLARGFLVIAPITLADHDLDWCDVADPARTPLGMSVIGEAALVLVPASGIDPVGARLGRGGGSYDRALARTSGLAVAVVWPWELRDDALPTEPHDRPVDAVLAPGVAVRPFG